MGKRCQCAIFTTAVRLLRSRVRASSSDASCFLSDSHDAFLDPSLVMGAHKETGIESSGGLIIGVDPAGASMTGDRTAIAWRKGRVFQKVAIRRRFNLMQIAGWVQNIVKQDKPDRLAIDITGLGVGLYAIVCASRCAIGISL